MRKAINLLKTILPENAFFGRGSLGLIIFLTDDSNAERNALKHVNLKESDFCTCFTFYRHFGEMDSNYYEFAQTFYYVYPLFQKHFEFLWERHQCYALSFRVGLPTRKNNTNNYVEHSMSGDYLKLRINILDTYVLQNVFCVLAGKDEIGTCTCPIRVSGAPCKHQGAVAMKYHIAILNSIPSLTSEVRMIYAYVACSFYALLRPISTPQVQESTLQDIYPNNILDEHIERRVPNEESTDIDYTSFVTFLEEVKSDYQIASPQLRTALDKFAERYCSAKSKSFPQLTCYLYDLNRSLNPTARVKSGSMIRVQVESVKRRKTKGSGGRKRKLPNTICDEKETLNPHVIPARKRG
ncbi:4984_t:CDS:2 [Funneliformis mosseae]|uniref:4984_t:CDS:1 n=1 Tax=Funneliformis mosseae TaxID=27381 RepID=A0A9N9AI31_FUNMO|nr:4984_t:CDS:2 [Funneliformis mosseae]